MPSVSVAAKPSVPKDSPVTLDLYVMSHCPFGIKAENAIFPAVRALAPLVDLNLYFIANETAGPNGAPAFQSMHGQGEVEENIRHLCAQKHFPKQYTDFILERNLNIQDAGWQAVATKVGIDPAVIEQCSTGEEGKRLLSENIKVSEKRQANASPTIDINATQYRGSRSLRSVTLALCDALQAKGVPQPKACDEAKKLPPDPVDTAGGCAPSGAKAAAPAANIAFDIQIVSDDTCSICQPTLIEALKRHHPKATVKILPASASEGQALLKAFQVQQLPFYVIDRKVEQEPDFNMLFQSYYAKLGDRYTVRTGPDTYMPTVYLNRPRVPRHLDVFVESLSPYTAEVESALLHLLHGSSTKNLTLSMHYIVQEATKASASAASGGKVAAGAVRAASVSELSNVTPGALASRRGTDEVQESLRQVCLFQHASAGDFFLYLECRNQNLMDATRSSTCLSTMPAAVQQCITGGEGDTLLRQDAALARELDIRGGPVLLWENRFGPFEWQEVDWKALIDKE